MPLFHSCAGAIPERKFPRSVQQSRYAGSFRPYRRCGPGRQSDQTDESLCGCIRWLRCPSCSDFRPWSLGCLLSLAGAEEKPDVFPQGRESLCASKWGFCPFRLVYGHADRCAVWASAPCGWSYVKGGLVLTPGQIRSVSPVARNHEEQLPQPCCPQCLPGLLLLLASRENSWPAVAARCSR